MKTSNRLSWLIVIAGIWEILAPFILGYSLQSRTAMWNDIIVGAVLIILAAWSAISNSVTTDRTLDWVNFVLGLWLIVAPFILAYSFITAAVWNDIIVGIIVAALAVWAALSIRRPVVEERPLDRQP